MKLLLDTHIWLWSVLNPEKLSKRVAKELDDSENEFWLSPVSAWEAFVLMSKRRIRIDGDPREWMTRALGSLREAPLTNEIVVAAHFLSLENADPADRFLAATAEVLGLTLVTADTRLLGLGRIATLGNR